MQPYAHVCSRMLAYGICGQRRGLHDGCTLRGLAHKSLGPPYRRRLIVAQSDAAVQRACMRAPGASCLALLVEEYKYCAAQSDAAVQRAASTLQVCWRMLTYGMLPSAYVCVRTYADVC